MKSVETDIGQLCILVSSFTGSGRYTKGRRQDAIECARSYGRLDLFITFTCNAKWKDSQDGLQSG